MMNGQKDYRRTPEGKGPLFVDRSQPAPTPAFRLRWRRIYIEILQAHLTHGEKKELATFLGITPQMLSALLHPEDRRAPSLRVIEGLLRFFEGRMDPSTLRRLHLALLRAAGQPALQEGPLIRRADPVELLQSMERFLQALSHLPAEESLLIAEEWLERTARLLREPCPSRERWVYMALRMIALAAAASIANLWDDLDAALRWGQAAEAWARRLSRQSLPGSAGPWRELLFRWLAWAGAASASGFYNSGNPRAALKHVEDARRWLEELSAQPEWRHAVPHALVRYHLLSLASARIPYARRLPKHPWTALERDLDHLRAQIEEDLPPGRSDLPEPVLERWLLGLQRYMAQAVLEQGGPPARAWSWLEPAWDRFPTLEPLAQVMVLRTTAAYAWRIGDLDLLEWTLQEAVRRAHAWGFRNQLAKIRRIWSSRIPTILEEVAANFNQL
ncbi:MAG: hypothetical protein RQ897_09360 [Thermoflexus sp.]|jgi:transcriptional regulator with XRE-family HTH domain|nr:hypothetical protein [Thermoflexus sp.]MDT7948536.1 hypothetical protein [Thermoflexus sp.]